MKKIITPIFFTIMSLMLLTQESNAKSNCRDGASEIFLFDADRGNYNCIKDVTTVDLDGDQRPDIVYLLETGIKEYYHDRVYKIVWRKNMGDGKFSSTQVIRSITRNTFFETRDDFLPEQKNRSGFSFPFEKANLVLKDLDKDGLVDIIFSLGRGIYKNSNSWEAYNEVVWYKNNGRMSFSEKKSPFAIKSGVIASLTIEDYNGDDILDIGYTAIGDDIIIPRGLNGVFLGKGKGLFHPDAGSIRTGSHENDFKSYTAVGKFSTDPYQSVVYLYNRSGNNNRYKPLLIAGNIGFDKDGRIHLPTESYQLSYFKSGQSGGVTKPTVRDFNVDGLSDLLVNIDGVGAYIYTFVSNDFLPYEDKITDRYTTSVRAIDVDGDGLLDIVYSSYEISLFFFDVHRLAWRKNLGSRKFSSERLIKKPSSYTELAAVGDFNGNGMIDLVTLSVKGKDKKSSLTIHNDLIPKSNSKN